MKEATFKTSIIIIPTNDKMNLGASPCIEDIKCMLTNVIKRIPRQILKHCYPLDGLLQKEYLNRYEGFLSDKRNGQKTHPSCVLSSITNTKTAFMKQSFNNIERISCPELPYIGNFIYISRCNIYFLESNLIKIFR